MGTPAWYVMHTKPRKEQQAHAYLLAHGYEDYFPAVSVKRVDPRSSDVEPFFPGYLFVLLDLAEVGLSALQWVPGTKGLVQFGGEPTPVPSIVIDQLRARLALPSNPPRERMFEAGDLVEIVAGPLAGYEGIFDVELSSNQRVQILLELLGGLARVTLSRDTIKKKSVGQVS